MVAPTGTSELRGKNVCDDRLVRFVSCVVIFLLLPCLANKWEQCFLVPSWGEAESGSAEP